MSTTYIARSGGRVAKLTVDDLTVTTAASLPQAVAVVPPFDANGHADGLILDEDADTKIRANTDDQIDIFVNNALDFQITPNVFAALAGSLITGEHRLATQALTATGVVTIRNGLVTLAHNSVVIAATLPTLAAGDLVIAANISASGSAAHTVTLPAGMTYVGGSNTIATLNAPGEVVAILAVSGTQAIALFTVGTVVYS